MKIDVLLFKKSYEGERIFIPIADIPLEFLVPENNIMINVEPGENRSNGWEEGRTRLIITHNREQTEEEKAEHKIYYEQLKAKSKKVRHEQYLRLKKEFE